MCANEAECQQCEIFEVKRQSVENQYHIYYLVKKPLPAADISEDIMSAADRLSKKKNEHLAEKRATAKF